MSGVQWQPRDEGSGPARFQRIASNSQFTKTQKAYRAYINHGRDCAVCAVDSMQCTSAEKLWRAYKAATSS
ncbi:hypothetical protein ABT186_05210 [Streptomyces sp. NPDC001634]|uniref:hypothetical protein n=1 Tax=Streptomyces sp. NPDC001634 TaxID=3154390 RepID=UPI0033280428